MVQLRSLYNDPENRNIMAVVDTPTGPVTVFEPSQEDIRTIMAMDDMIAAFNQNNDNGENDLDISETSILKDLIPMLTDLEIGDMSDEEIAKVIENLNIEGAEIMAVLTNIVTHIYIVMIKNFQNDLELTRMTALSKDFSDKSLGMYITKAATTDEGRKQMQEINKQASKIKKQGEENKVVDMKDASILKPDSYESSVKEEVADRFGDLD